METLIAILIVAVLCGVPAFFVARAIQKVDKEEVTPPAEVIKSELSRGFRTMFIGLDLVWGSIPLLVATAVCAGLGGTSLLFSPFWSVGTMAVGLVVFGVGRVIVGCQTRRINFIKGRERTPLEEWTLAVMEGIESRQGAALFDRVAIETGIPALELAAIANGSGIILTLYRIGRVFVGGRFLRNHWILLLMVLAAAGLLVRQFAL
jgi:hypothetical protein